MRIKTYNLSGSFALTVLSFVILLCDTLHFSTSSAIYSTVPSESNHRWSYSRVKRQLFRGEIPTHRPLSGNIYAEHHGFPHPGRWHPNPQGILPPNPFSGHHFDNPNVIITDDDFNLYGSTLQHLDHQNTVHHQAVPIHHPPPIPESPHAHHAHSHSSVGHKKRRPIKILVHHHVEPKPLVHHYPVEYGKLIPIGDGGVAITNEGHGGIESPVLPIIAAHHHQNYQNLEHQNPGLSYAQEYKHVALEHEQKSGYNHLKVKNLFHQGLKFPHRFGKFGTEHPSPILKSVFPLRYGVHDERSKDGAFSWSIAY